MELYFLGTGAGRPSRERNVTSIALNLLDERGTFWLFDCGEGTQHQMIKSPLKLSKLEKVFITHLHGDHIYGLPGLITTRSHQGVKAPLTIYGPPGLRGFVDAALTASQAHLDFELTMIEFEEGIVFEDVQFTVETAMLEHRIDSYGFRIQERDQPGKLLAEKLQERGIPPGPVYAQLKNGQDVTLNNGEVLHSTDYVGKEYPGRTIAIMGDTRICNSINRLARNADVFVLEATFGEAKQDLAHQYFHLTTAQAAQIAIDSCVKALIMTHISSRYQHRDTLTLLEEARSRFPNTYIAEDLWSYYIGRKT